jgi:superfamily II DNA or RNA helicase
MTETVFVQSGIDFQARQLCVVQLSFAYGGVTIRVSDEREGFFVSQGNAVAQVSRDRSAERAAQCLLEGFGAVELACMDHVCTDTDADYLVSSSDSVHALCSFTAYALPQLKTLGWQVQVDENYPYQVVSSDTPWYADITPDPEEDDWFSLELGVDIDGRRVNLLPGLIEILNSGSDSDSVAELLRAPARFRAVPVGENRYVVVPPERLTKLLAILEELYGGASDSRFSAESAPLISELDDVFNKAGRFIDDHEGEAPDGQLKLSGPGELLTRGRNLSEPKPPSVKPPEGLKASLRSYQQEGLDWLQSLVRNQAGGVLADDMGLGKTLQTIAHITAEKEAGRLVEPCLIVVPKSLAANWQRELKRFSPALKVLSIHGALRAKAYADVAGVDVVITTYPVLVRDKDKFSDRNFHLLVLDEAQAIKNSRSLAHRAVQDVNATHRLCLTGTPVENNLGELWSLFNFLMPNLLGDLQTFKARYQIPIERDQQESRLVQLRSRVAPYILRRTKLTVAKDLPPKTELVRPVDLEGDQRDLYESIRVAAHAEVRQVIRQKGLTGSTITILSALMKLRQVCCDPRLLSTASARAVKTSAKYDLLFELLEAQLAGSHRILIFSQFTQMLALIAEGLRSRDIRYLALTGATQDRQARCDEFESGKADVFLISLKAGGTGLNLTSADTVIHYDPWWNPAAQAQATDRAYRIGQKRPVFVYNLIIAGSVEERMLRLQRHKRHLADTILGDGTLTKWSESDVEQLFEPLPE